MDCEFIAQAMILNQAAAHPALLEGGTLGAIQGAGAVGLLTPGDAETLAASWSLQSALTQATRLCFSGPFDEAEARPVFKRRLAALLDKPDFAYLTAELVDLQKQTRQIFERVIGKVKTGG